MVAHYRSEFIGMLDDYGCSAVGQFDHVSASVGRPVDEIDSALHVWRLCVRCAQKALVETVQKYDFERK